MILEFTKEAAIEKGGVVGDGASEETGGTLDDIACPSVARAGEAG